MIALEALAPLTLDERGLINSLLEVKEPMELELPPCEMGLVMTKPGRMGRIQLRELNEKEFGVRIQKQVEEHHLK